MRELNCVRPILSAFHVLRHTLGGMVFLAVVVTLSGLRDDRAITTRIAHPSPLPSVASPSSAPVASSTPSEDLQPPRQSPGVAATDSGDPASPDVAAAPVAPTPAPRDVAAAPVAPTPAPRDVAAAPVAPTPAPQAQGRQAVPPPAPRQGGYIIIPQARLATLPVTGSAWLALKAAADGSAGTPDLSNMDQDNNVFVLAKALVYARTREPKYRDEVVANLKAAVGTEGGGTLALGREIGAYAIAADLIDLSVTDPGFDAQTFRPWLRGLLKLPLDGLTLQTTHEQRANNWGTQAGASRAAIAAYLGDASELARVAQVFKGWLGDRTSR